MVMLIVISSLVTFHLGPLLPGAAVAGRVEEPLFHHGNFPGPLFGMLNSAREHVFL